MAEGNIAVRGCGCKAKENIAVRGCGRKAKGYITARGCGHKTIGNITMRGCKLRPFGLKELKHGEQAKAVRLEGAQTWQASNNQQVLSQGSSSPAR
jgi:hypothetical protein